VSQSTLVADVNHLQENKCQQVSADKNVWCVARHVKNKKNIKKLTLAKILCWTFRQLLLPSSAGIKNAKI